MNAEIPTLAEVLAHGLWAGVMIFIVVAVIAAPVVLSMLRRSR